MKYILFALVFTVAVGCTEEASPPDTSSVPSSDSSAVATTESAVSPSTDREAFAEKWRSANVGERQKMADLSKIHPMFIGSTKKDVEASLGKPGTSGVDKFAEDIMRYELGAMPADMGGGKCHLTFVFENDVVVRVMGNSITF